MLFESSDIGCGGRRTVIIAVLDELSADRDLPRDMAFLNSATQVRGDSKHIFLCKIEWRGLRFTIDRNTRKIIAKSCKKSDSTRRDIIQFVYKCFVLLAVHLKDLVLFFCRNLGG